MKIRFLSGVILVVFVMTGCITHPAAQNNSEGGVDLTPVASGEHISMTTEDSIRLDATFFPAKGKVAVVFAHMGIDNQTSWQAFASEIAQAGMPAFTFDFRCFGKSECFTDFTQMTNLRDVRAAIAYLRGRGYQKIVCVGASMGASACLNASLQEKLAGLVYIAGAKSIRVSGLEFPLDMIDPTIPKLFIVSDNDRYAQVVTDTPMYYDLAPQPKQFIHYPETVHGTELFASQSGSQFHQALMDFLLAIQ